MERVQSIDEKVQEMVNYIAGLSKGEELGYTVKVFVQI
jgi:hypothetical protein